jgi:hypothetical protein
MVRREEVQWCVREVMEGNMSDEFKKNAIDCSHKAKKAMGEGGSSDAQHIRFLIQISVSQLMDNKNI